MNHDRNEAIVRNFQYASTRIIPVTPPLTINEEAIYYHMLIRSLENRWFATAKIRGFQGLFPSALEAADKAAGDELYHQWLNTTK